jgi:hypothetical protein
VLNEVQARFLAKPEPPRMPAIAARRLTPAKRRQYAGKPTWNGKPKRDWEGPELPPRPDAAHREQ